MKTIAPHTLMLGPVPAAGLFAAPPERKALSAVKTAVTIHKRFSKAPNTTAARVTRHQLGQPRSSTSAIHAARATHAANQKMTVTTSIGSRSKGLAMFGMKRGTAMRKTSAKRVQMVVKRKKLTRLGESEKKSTTWPIKPMAMMFSRNWTPRNGRVRSMAKMTDVRMQHEVYD